MSKPTQSFYTGPLAHYSMNANGRFVNLAPCEEDAKRILLSYDAFALGPDDIDVTWATVRSQPAWTFVVPTSHPDRISASLPDDWGNGYPNVWLAAEASTQAEVNQRVPHLLSIPAVCWGLILEGMKGEISIQQWSPPNSQRHWMARCPKCRYVGDAGHVISVDYWGESDELPCPSCKAAEVDYDQVPGRIQFMCVSGQADPDAGPLHPDWVRSLRDQCSKAGVAFRFDGWGEWTPGSQCEHLTDRELSNLLCRSVDYKGVTSHAFKTGPDSNVHLLDGQLYNQLPITSP